MLSRSGRPLAQALFGPIAKVFIRAGITADQVTIAGTVLTSALALTLIPTNHLILGPWLILAAVIFDNLDGQIARRTGTSSAWGAFLDSTMDRIADGALFLAVGMWAWQYADDSLRAWTLAGTALAMWLGSVVPYARARAESIGAEANVGLAERADRLAVILIVLFLTGLGLGQWWITAGVWLLSLGAAITIVQRIIVVAQQKK
ncbi:MAG: CDP-alcohol phosphatidyltransferase family protein [Flaviflexus sp.]|nr:CDP-alcohol phosphatidyltransferase family protein [Flaviflexus sp.]